MAVDDDDEDGEEAALAPREQAQEQQQPQQKAQPPPSHQWGLDPLFWVRRVKAKKEGGKRWMRDN
jgi:hypothetical protein